jgi:glycolate oxidase FAD binding subunit
MSNAPIDAAPLASSDRPATDAALHPTTEDEVLALVREGVAKRRPFVVEGRGTKRHHGPAAAEDAVRVSLARLADVTALEPGDLVMSARAGARLLDVQAALAAHGQWLPVDPPYADATIGGILATASSGPRRLGYGTIKDHLLGLRLIGASGEITRSGGRVVKNVTGYDLHRLQVGGFGALGVVLEAHFKVAPLPRASCVVAFACDRLAVAHRLLLDVQARRGLRPVALEARERAALEALRAGAPGLPSSGALALVGVEGSPAVVARHLRELTAQGDGARPMVVLEGPDAHAVWAAFREAPGRRPNDVVVRVGARPFDLPALLETFDPTDAGAVGVSVQAGTGLARIAFPATVDPGALVATLVMWHAQAAQQGGYAVVEAAPIALAGRDALPFTTGPSRLAQRLKQAFDPDGVINRGRVTP